jgi:hypothetical protein
LRGRYNFLAYKRILLFTYVYIFLFTSRFTMFTKGKKTPSAKDYATLLNCSVNNVYKLFRNGKLNGVQLLPRGRIYFNVAQYEELVKNIKDIDIKS